MAQLWRAVYMECTQDLREKEEIDSMFLDRGPRPSEQQKLERLREIPYACHGTRKGYPVQSVPFIKQITPAKVKMIDPPRQKKPSLAPSCLLRKQIRKITT